MSTSIDGLELLLKSILATAPWMRDPNVTPIPWRTEIVTDTIARASSKETSDRKRPLKFGIYWTNNVITPHPPIQRGLKLVVNAVEKAGHKVRIIRILFVSVSKTNFKGGSMESS
jgi:amidase